MNTVPMEKALNPLETEASPADQANAAFNHKRNPRPLKVQKAELGSHSFDSHLLHIFFTQSETEGS